jgi:hypothetical protein
MKHRAGFSQRGSNAAEIAAECEAIKQALAGEPPHSVLSIMCSIRSMKPWAGL